MGKIQSRGLQLLLPPFAIAVRPTGGYRSSAFLLLPSPLPRGRRRRRRKQLWCLARVCALALWLSMPAITCLVASHPSSPRNSSMDNAWYPSLSLSLSLSLFSPFSLPPPLYLSLPFYTLSLFPRFPQTFSPPPLTNFLFHFPSFPFLFPSLIFTFSPSYVYLLIITYPITHSFPLITLSHSLICLITLSIFLSPTHFPLYHHPPYHQDLPP